MSSVRVACLRVEHLFRVSVIGGYAKDVAGLFASVVHGLDRSVGGANSDNSSVVVTRVSDLPVNAGLPRENRYSPCQEGQSCT